MKNPNVLVIGDTILDRYVEGRVDRISPEAPVPVLLRKDHWEVLGGACNVAANIGSLTGYAGEVDFFGFGSMDVVRMLAEQRVNFCGVAVTKEVLLTKTRYISDNHKLLREDKNEEYEETLR